MKLKILIEYLSPKALWMILFCISGHIAHLSSQSINPVRLIERIIVKKNKLSIELNAYFRKKYLKDNFFVEYDQNINLEKFDYSILTMPCIMNLISVIWISGDVYCVDEMDAELYHSLQRIKKVMQLMYPRTAWNGELRAAKLIAHPFDSSLSQEKRTALLFSGGIDSWSSMLAHLDKKQLLITAWGHWDLPLHEAGMWKIRKSKIEECARQFGNEVSFLKSNYQAFLNWEYLSSLTPEIPKWRLGAVEGLGWAGLTAPILLTRGYQTLRIASSHTWLYPYPSAATPYIDNNLYFCGLRVLHDQYDMTRGAKIAHITQTLKEHSLEKPFLKICSYEKKQDKNCCTCRKCISTIMGFYAHGEDPLPYGLQCSLALAWERTEELLKRSHLNAYTILYFKGLQNTLRNRVNGGEKIPKELHALLSIDLGKKTAAEASFQSILPRNELAKLLPGLIVPAQLEGMVVGDEL